MYFPVFVNVKKRSEDETEEGLGSLPRNISSVSSLLLFNTTENLCVHTRYLQKSHLFVSVSVQPTKFFFCNHIVDRTSLSGSHIKLGKCFFCQYWQGIFVISKH